MKLKNKLLTSSLHNKTGEIPPRLMRLEAADYSPIERRVAAYFGIDTAFAMPPQEVLVKFDLRATGEPSK